MEKKRTRGLPTYEGSKKVYSLLTLLIIGEGAAIIAQAYFLARAVALLFSRSALTDVFSSVLLFFLFFLIRHIFVQAETALANHFSKQTADMLRDKLLRVYFKTDIAFYKNSRTGHLVTLLVEGVEQVKKYLEIIGIRVIKVVIVPVMIITYLLFIDFQSAIILIVTVPLIIFFMILLGVAAQKMADSQYETYQRLSNHFVDTLKGLETLLYLGKSKAHEDKIETVSNTYRKATMKTLRIAFLSSFALDFFTSISIAFVAVGLGFRLIDGEILLFPALTVLLLSPEYFSSIKQVGKDYHATLDGQLAMTEINSFIEYEERTLGNSAGKMKPIDANSTILVENLHVSIGGKDILRNLSFCVNTGWIGIIGESGAGKSTLLQTLAGRIVPSNGKIYINNERLTVDLLAEWQKQIAYIPQQPYIFPLSIADNIRFYEPDASDNEIEEIIVNIGLADFIERMPNGIHEKIGEGGHSLSGGQEQRIAIARALIGNKPVILLDEPTAHLDIETEYEISQLMRNLFQDKFVFLVTHRLHWLNYMDYILLLQDGEIIEHGTHSSLMNEKGSYERFVATNRRSRE